MRNKTPDDHKAKVHAAFGLIALGLIVAGAGIGPAIAKTKSAKETERGRAAAQEAELARAQTEEDTRYAKDILEGKGLPDLASMAK